MKILLPLAILLCTNVCLAQEDKTYRSISDELAEKQLKKFMKDLSGTFRYPPDSRRKGIEGTVKIEFAINPDGTVSDFSVVESVAPDLDEEALRALKIVGEKTSWEKLPGRRWILFPFRFKLG